MFILDLEDGSERRVTDALAPTSWSPDGRYLLAENLEGAWLVAVEGNEDIVPVGSRNGRTRRAVFSPNGDYVAFDSDETGRQEVYVVPTPPGTGVQEPVSINGGFAPKWSVDGAELYFIALDASLTAVSVDTGENFSAGLPEALFTVSSEDYAVSRDGQRFLIPAAAQGEDRGGTIKVVLNWWAELEQ